MLKAYAPPQRRISAQARADLRWSADKPRAEARALAERLGARVDGSESLPTLHGLVVASVVPGGADRFEDGTLPLTNPALAAMYAVVRCLMESE